jgi:uncharacterized repeat protein (TIGR01451 family)
MQIGKNMPAEVAFGEEFMYEINTKALACAGDIVVTDIVPEGAAYVRSEPPAQVDGNRLTWRISEMDAGQAQTLKVWVKAQREGTLASCATVHALPRACGSTKVGRAQIAIAKTGPETAILGSDFSYNIVVSNKGTSMARSVVVTDELPEGLTNPNGRRLSFNVGDLGPGQSKQIAVPVKAAARGRHCNVAKVTTANAGEANAEACTTVLQPGLKLVKTGTKEQFLSRVAKYDIVVSNTGDTTLNGVTVTDTAPAATTIVAAPGATVTGKTATWNVGSLRPKEEKAFTISLTTGQAGNHCNSAVAATTEGLRQTAEACTLWSGIGAVLLEVVDDPDPIIVGDETTYTIRVTNQGTANLNNVKTSFVCDAETQPTTASAGTVSGQAVTFPTVRTLPPKQSFTYTVKVKGVKAGDSRNRVTITSDEIPKPVVEEESTTVY